MAAAIKKKRRKAIKRAAKRLAREQSVRFRKGHKSKTWSKRNKRGVSATRVHAKRASKHYEEAQKGQEQRIELYP